MGEPTFSIDPFSLRDYPDDFDRVDRWLQSPEGNEVANAGARVGWLRMVGRLDEAEALAWQMLRLSGGPPSPEAPSGPLPAEAALPAVRLAQVLHWKRDWVTAMRLLDAALDALPVAQASVTHQSRRAFALQHRGKLLLDVGETNGAIRDFSEALRLRELGAPPDQIESSRQALTEATRRKRLT